MAKVLIPIATGFEEIEALTLVDVLRRAEIEVVMAGLSEDMPSGAHGVSIKTDTMLENVKVDDFDMMLLPGGLPGAEYLAKSQKVQSLLKEFDEKKKYIGAICAAPWALRTARVLKDSYTCYPSFEKTIGEDGYDSQKDVVIDKNIMTSRGPGTAMKFALEIVKSLRGEKVFEDVKNGLLV